MSDVESKSGGGKIVDKNFESFYKKEMKDIIERLEHFRKVTLIKVLGILSIGILYFIILNISKKYIPENIPYRHTGVLAVTFLPVLYVVIKSAMRQMQNYRKKFSIELMSAFTRSIGDDFDYTPNACISEHEYLESNMFNYQVKEYSGENYVEGSFHEGDEKINMRFSELKIIENPNFQKLIIKQDYFEGFFIVVDFYKKFNSITQVASRNLDYMFKKKYLVKLEDVEFNKKFTLYSQDQQESRYIMTPSLMNRILNYSKYVGKEINIVFNNNKMYMRINHKKSIFSTSVFRRVDNYEKMKMNYEVLKQVIDIIDELKLNNKIWSQEEKSKANEGINLIDEHEIKKEFRSNTFKVAISLTAIAAVMTAYSIFTNNYIEDKLYDKVAITFIIWLYGIVVLLGLVALCFRMWFSLKTKIIRSINKFY